MKRYKVVFAAGGKKKAVTLYARSKVDAVMEAKERVPDDFRNCIVAFAEIKRSKDE